MDLKELKKQVEKIRKELKSKASGDSAVLVDSLSFLFSIMLETSAGILVQNEKIAKQNPEEAAKTADEIIKNTYRTLMTRGMKGCYVYCCDEGLAEYLKSSIGNTK